MENENLPNLPNEHPPSPPWLLIGAIFIGLGVCLLIVFFNPAARYYLPVPPKGSSADLLVSSPLAAEVMREIRSGALPPLEEDWVVGQGYDLTAQDWLIIIAHSSTSLYLEKIGSVLREKFIQTQPIYPLQIKLQDDRFVKQSETSILPNGTIFFGASLVLKAKSEAELAAVLAHEIAHLALRHHARRRLFRRNATRLQQQYVESGDVLRIDALAIADWILLGMPERGSWGLLESECQSEADLKAQEILIKADYDFSAMLGAVPAYARRPEHERFEAIQKRSEEYYKNHPRGKLFLLSSAKELGEIQRSLQTYLAQR